MALFRRLFYRKPPDRLLEITDRVYVFDCCFSTKKLEEEEFKTYIDGIILQLQDHFPDASFMVFNFRPGEGKSLISSLLSLHNITTKDYPHQFSGCPLLPLDTIFKFLIMSEAWLTTDSSSQNIMLMHCESGGWPLLAFMLASLLLYRRQYTGEQRTLEMVYKQGPKELLGLLSPLNPTSSHLRYLQYVGNLTNALERQPQLENPFTLDCLILRAVPNFDGKDGCRPIVRVYGQDSSGFVDKSSQMLFSTSKAKKYVKHYKKAPIKLNVGCRVEGDVVLECIHLDKTLEPQQVIFRVMFNTRFIQSHILALTLDDIDLAWESKDHFPKDFKAEVLFSEFHAESDASGSDIEMDFGEEFFEAEEMLETPDLHDEYQRDPDSSFFDPYGRNTVEFATPRAESGSYFPFATSARKRPSEETTSDDSGLIMGMPGEESFLHDVEQELEMLQPIVSDVSVIPVEINAALCKLITPQALSPPPLLLLRPMLKETASVTSLHEENVVKQNIEHTSSLQLLAMEIPTSSQHVSPLPPPLPLLASPPPPSANIQTTPSKLSYSNEEKIQKLTLSQRPAVLNPPPLVSLSSYTHKHVQPFEGETRGPLPTIPSPQPVICYKDHELLSSNREGTSHPSPLVSTRDEAVHLFLPPSMQPIVEMISILQTPSEKTKTTPPPMPLYTAQATSPTSFASLFRTHEDASSPSPPFPTGHGKILPPPPPPLPPPPQISNATSTSSTLLLRTRVCSELSPSAQPPRLSQTSNAPSTSSPFLSLPEVCNGSLSPSPPKPPSPPQIFSDRSTLSPFLSSSKAFSRLSPPSPPPPPRTSNDSSTSSPLLSSIVVCSGPSPPPSPPLPPPPSLLGVSSDPSTSSPFLSSPKACSRPSPSPPPPSPPPQISSAPSTPQPLQHPIRADSRPPPSPPPPPQICSAPTSSPLQPPNEACSRSLALPSHHPQISNNSISSFKPSHAECSKVSPPPPPPPPLPFKSCGSSRPPTTCNEPPLATPPRGNDRGQPLMECNVPPLPPLPPPPPEGFSRPQPPLPPSPLPPPRGFSRPQPPLPPSPPPPPGGFSGPPPPPPPPRECSRPPPPPPPPGGHTSAPPPLLPPGGHTGAPPPPPPPGGYMGAPPPPPGDPPPGGHIGAPPPLPRATSGAPPPPPIPRGHGGAPLPPTPPGGHKAGIPGPPMAPGAPPPPPRGANPHASLKGFPGNLVSGRGPGIGRSASSIKKSSLKPLHWNKVTRIMNGTLWAELQRQSSELQIQEDFDVNELEQLFSVVVRKPNDGSKSEGKPKSAGSKSDKVQLIDLRRANNTEIMLTKIKMPLSDMMNAILTMDDSTLDGDQVENLLKFCPTKEEMESLKAFTGDKETLGKCEQYFLELMKVPRVESKLRVFSFKIQFISQMSDVKKSLQLVGTACDEIRNSEKLKEIMKKILNLGNTMNQGTARGSAVGFRLDSLLKLADTRGKDSKVTLMHYLCKVTATKWPHLMDFHEELASLEIASKIQLKILTEEQESISKGLKRAEGELKASKEDGPVSEIFRKTLEGFVTKSQADVEHMKALYTAVDQSAKDLSVYFGEDPSKCPFEQVIGTILNFMRLFRKAHEENLKYAEMEKKKAQKDAELEKTNR